MTRREAGVAAFVVGDLISVIAGLVTGLTFGDIRSDNTVTADRLDAVVSTGVSVELVLVIAALNAGFALGDVFTDKPVAADR